MAAFSRFGVAGNPGSEIGVALRLNSRDRLCLEQTEVVDESVAQTSGAMVSMGLLVLI